MFIDIFTIISYFSVTQYTGLMTTKTVEAKGTYSESSLPLKLCLLSFTYLLKYLPKKHYCGCYTTWYIVNNQNLEPLIYIKTYNTHIM